MEDDEKEMKEKELQARKLYNQLAKEKTRLDQQEAERVEVEAKKVQYVQL